MTWRSRKDVNAVAEGEFMHPAAPSAEHGRVARGGLDDSKGSQREKSVRNANRLSHTNARRRL